MTPPAHMARACGAGRAGRGRLRVQAWIAASRAVEGVCRGPGEAVGLADAIGCEEGRVRRGLRGDLVRQLWRAAELSREAADGCAGRIEKALQRVDAVGEPQVRGLAFRAGAGKPLDECCAFLFAPDFAHGRGPAEQRDAHRHALGARPKAQGGAAFAARVMWMRHMYCAGSHWVCMRAACVGVPLRASVLLSAQDGGKTFRARADTHAICVARWQRACRAGKSEARRRESASAACEKRRARGDGGDVMTHRV